MFTLPFCYNDLLLNLWLTLIQVNLILVRSTKTLCKKEFPLYSLGASIWNISSYFQVYSCFGELKMILEEVKTSQMLIFLPKFS
jgi:hypothetical protein